MISLRVDWGGGSIGFLDLKAETLRSYMGFQETMRNEREFMNIRLHTRTMSPKERAAFNDTWFPMS